jgi:hypothetical protein
MMYIEKKVKLSYERHIMCRLGRTLREYNQGRSQKRGRTTRTNESSGGKKDRVDKSTGMVIPTEPIK